MRKSLLTSWQEIGKSITWGVRPYKSYYKTFVVSPLFLWQFFSTQHHFRLNVLPEPSLKHFISFGNSCQIAVLTGLQASKPV
jgi:hypothetical protein